MLLLASLALVVWVSQQLEALSHALSLLLGPPRRHSPLRGFLQGDFYILNTINMMSRPNRQLDGERKHQQDLKTIGKPH